MMRELKIWSYGLDGKSEDESLYSEEDLRCVDEKIEKCRNKHQDI